MAKIFIVLFPANDMPAHYGFLVLLRKNGPVAYLVCGSEGYCRRVETAASMLFESVSEYGVSGGSGGLRNIKITQRRRNGLSWFGSIRSLRPAVDYPYTQEHPKSRGYNRV